MKEKILTVIVPIYNVQKYLEKCLESIINQSYQNLEIILVDDGSSDQSGKIADTYKEKDNRIQVIHKENGGLLSAKYAGISIASGTYVTFVDGDDWIKKSMYEELMMLMVENDVDIVTSGCIRFYSEQRQIESYDYLITPGLYDIKMIREKIIPIMLWNKKMKTWALDPSTCFKIYKREKLLPIIELLKDKKLYYGEDSAITYTYMLRTENIYCTNLIFYYHRQREPGNTAPYLLNDGFFHNLISLYDFLYTIFSEHEYKNELIKQLDYFFIKSAKYKKLKYEPMLTMSNNYYLFPFNKIKYMSTMVIYGAGKVGQDYIEQIRKINYGEIVLWIDRNYDKLGDEVSNPEKIIEIQYDYVVIAIARNQMANEVLNWLLSKGISEEKIIYQIECLQKG